MELIKEAIFMVMGAIIMCFGVITKAGWEVVGLGACVFGFATGLFVAEIVNQKRK